MADPGPRTWEQIRQDAPYRVLVTGSRNWADGRTVCEALNGIADQVGISRMVIIHGNASRGADRIADAWACRNGARLERYPATWDLHGKAAGFIRNQAMVTLGASLCLAFIAECSDPKCRRQPPERHGSHGASQCADLAERAGIPLQRFGPWRDRVGKT